MNNEYILEMRNICKDYSGNHVLNDINLKVKRGEILALVGENGAGKSTLMNILFGMPVIHSTGGFKGEVLIDGSNARISNPQEAMEYGIGMVHQEFMLINGYEINENVKLNRENIKENFINKILGNKVGLLDRKRMKDETAITLNELGLKVGTSEMTGTLPVGIKQFIEIARELNKTNIKLIVLDEPTAVLTESEAEKFLQCVKEVSLKGISFIFISHRLKEVKQYSDNIVVMRDGEVVGDYRTEDISLEKISELMIGHSVEFTDKTESNTHTNEIALELKNFAVDMPGEILKESSLKVYKGEIIGIAGLAGHGKAAIANGLMGLYPTTGEAYLNGKEIDVTNTLATLQKGVSDRKSVV